MVEFFKATAFLGAGTYIGISLAQSILLKQPFLACLTSLRMSTCG